MNESVTSNLQAIKPDAMAEALRMEAAIDGSIRRGKLMWAAAEQIDAMAAVGIRREAENERLRAALTGIEAFGRKNAGYGYSCAKLARAALSEPSGGVETSPPQCTHEHAIAIAASRGLHSILCDCGVMVTQVRGALSESAEGKS